MQKSESSQVNPVHPKTEEQARYETTRGNLRVRSGIKRTLQESRDQLGNLYLAEIMLVKSQPQRKEEQTPELPMSREPLPRSTNIKKGDASES